MRRGFDGGVLHGSHPDGLAPGLTKAEGAHIPETETEVGADLQSLVCGNLDRDFILGRGGDRDRILIRFSRLHQ